MREQICTEVLYVKFIEVNLTLIHINKFSIHRIA